MNEHFAEKTEAEVWQKQMSVLASPSGLTIGFLDGACDDAELLRNQILATVKASFSPSTKWLDLIREEKTSAEVLRVSLFSNVPADILLTFDLADRNYFRLFSQDGRELVQQFRKILVPGQWLRKQLLADSTLQLNGSDVLAVGSPRIDFLRALSAAKTSAAQDGPFKVLFAPLHENWFDREGQPLSVGRSMDPYIRALRTRMEIDVIMDGRNKDDKRPITSELLAADIVITDYTSLIYEAWALGKPVVFPHWLCADRVMEKAPNSAEAHIYRERIGHHADSFEHMVSLLQKGRELDLGRGVELFMAEFLLNWAAPQRSTVAQALEQLADPERELRQNEMRADIAAAIREKKWDAAEKLASELLNNNPYDVGLLDSLAKALNAQGKWWQELSALEDAVRLSPANSALYNRLGIAKSRLGQYQGAAAAFGKVITLSPKKATADLIYKIATSYETEGVDGPPDLRRAAEAYKAACAKDTVVNRFGAGALHASAGRWREAQSAYKTRVHDRALEAELHYRLGFSYDRCYEWELAEECYIRALALEYAKPSWHYRLGFVLERQEKFEAAAAAYIHAAKLSKTHQPKWLFRAGYALEKAGQLQEACEAYGAVRSNAPLDEDPYKEQFSQEQLSLYRAQLALRPDDAGLLGDYGRLLRDKGDISAAAKSMADAIARSVEPNPEIAKELASLERNLRERSLIEARFKHNCTRAGDWLRYSELLEKDNHFDEAVEAINQAIFRSNEHVPEWHARLGLLLARVGRLAESCEAFRGQELVQRAHGAYEDKLDNSAELREAALYREFYDTLPILKNTILYESFGGEGCSDNPLAIFLHVQKDKRFKGWRHFWVVDDLAKSPVELRNRKDVFFVLKESLLYQKLLCSVEFLINNGTFPSYYVRKDGQEYLNTWHGTPLKTLGYDIEATPLQRANTARNLIQASMFIAPNAHTEHVMLNRYGVRNLFTGKSLLTGYPRIDLLIGAISNSNEKASLYKRLGLDPNKPIVLFAPTYRGHWATPELEAKSLADTLERLKSADYNLIFRGHYFAERFIMEMDLPVVIAPHAIDTCTLLAVVDVLVTDYSSIFYDFLVTKRPVIHYVPDWDYYVETRGVYFGKDQLPGIVCETLDGLLKVLDDCIRRPAEQISSQYIADLECFCALEDGKASQRVIESFFFDRQVPQSALLPDGKAHFLVHSDELDDGMSLASLRGLLAAKRSEGNVCTLIVDRRVIINDEARIANAQSLLENCDIIIRFGMACFSLEEAWINDKMKTVGYQPTPRIRAAFENAIQHEVRRLFGHAQFDMSLEFDGRRPFWANLLSAVPAKCRALRLAGNTSREIERYYPYMERVLSRIESFDELYSESELLGEENSAYIGAVNGASGCFKVLAPSISESDISTRVERVPPDFEPVVLLSRSDQLVVGVIGYDHTIADRMVSLFARAQNGFLVLAFTGDSLAFGRDGQPDLDRTIAEQGMQNRVVILKGVADPLPVICRAACVLLAADLVFGAQIAAEAAFLSKPVAHVTTSALSDDLESFIETSLTSRGAPASGNESDASVTAPAPDLE